MEGGSGRGPGSQAAPGPGLAESRPLSIRHNNTQILGGAPSLMSTIAQSGQ